MLSYSQVTFEILRDELNIEFIQRTFVPTGLPDLPVPEWLSDYLRMATASAAVVRSEKAISEGIITPILYAVRQANIAKISLFSGEPLYHNDLGGICDFIIAAQPNLLLPNSPIVILVEAKRLDLLSGIPQCIAEMRTAQRLNERASRSGPVYGCVTIGTEWIFLKLEGDEALFDPTIFFSSQLPQVLALFQWMVDQFV